jgi:hypothetical protein
LVEIHPVEHACGRVRDFAYSHAAIQLWDAQPAQRALGQGVDAIEQRLRPPPGDAPVRASDARHHIRRLIFRDRRPDDLQAALIGH